LRSKKDIHRAHRTFERFFSEHGAEEHEQEYLRQNYPERKRTYYELLGVRKDASFE
jgi:hypothetical protein